MPSATASEYTKIAEQSAGKADASPPASVTKTPEGQSPEAKPSGEPTTAPEPYHPLLADIDLSELDDAAKAKVLEKVKAYDKHFHQSSKDLKEYQALRQRYLSDPDFADSLDAVLDGQPVPKAKPAPTAPSTPSERDAQQRLIDDLMSKAESAEERERLQKIRRMIREETQSDELTKRLAELEAKLERQERTTRTHRLELVAKELTALSEQFQPAFVEQHRRALLKLAADYPALSAKSLLYKVADPDALEEARLVRRVEDPKSTNGTRGPVREPRRPASTTAPSGSEPDQAELKIGAGKSARWSWERVARKWASKTP